MRVLIALVLLASTAHAAGSSEVTAEQAAKWVALFDKLVDSVITDRNDCEHMAAHITGLAVVNQPTIAMAREAKAQGKHLPVAAQQHLVDGLHRMIGALDKCGRDEKVAEAFRRLDLGR